jgi:hypothetical protein
MWSFPITVINSFDRFNPGQKYWISLPKRAGDLVESSSDRIVYRLENGDRELVEWEVVT